MLLRDLLHHHNRIGIKLGVGFCPGCRSGMDIGFCDELAFHKGKRTVDTQRLQSAQDLNKQSLTTL